MTAMQGIAPPTGDLGRLQLFFLAAAVFVVSAGYGALLPVLPAMISQQMPYPDSVILARHVGYLSGVYTAGVMIGALAWGYLSDYLGRPRTLIAGLTAYVASMLLLLLPSIGGLYTIYLLRFAAGVAVAAVVPMVPALVAAHTPKALRARRFAWLGAASLLGFLLGPGLNAAADALAGLVLDSDALPTLSARIVILLAAFLGAFIMIGLAWNLPLAGGASETAPEDAGTDSPPSLAALVCLNVAVMFALSGFELGIVLQGQQHTDLSTQGVALMFAECSLVMLVINALLFFTSMLDRVSPRVLLIAGVLIGMSGLAILALHQSVQWMFIGVSLTSAGTGLMLPVISFLAAGASPARLGATMSWLAVASGMGQALGSATGGWIFSGPGQSGFGWLILALLLALLLLLTVSSWGRPSRGNARPTTWGSFPPQRPER